VRTVLPRSNRAVRGHLVIRDVCETCNSKPLGDLDAAAKKTLVGTLGLDGAQPIHLRSDWTALTRWVLKIGFNDARISKREVSIYRELVPFILGSVASCPRPLTLVIGVIRPLTATPEEEAAGSRAMLSAIGVDRVGYLVDLDGAAIAPYFAVGVIVMCVIVWDPGVARANRRATVSQRCSATGWKDVPSIRAPLLRIAPGKVDARSWLMSSTLRPGMHVEP
jgi:hypothetical protein